MYGFGVQGLGHLPPVSSHSSFTGRGPIEVGTETVVGPVGLCHNSLVGLQ